MAGRNMSWEDFCKKIQAHVNVKQDGDIGAKTQAAIEREGGVVKVVRECLPSAIHAADDVDVSTTDEGYNCSDIYQRAYSYIGTAEIAGSRHNPTIIKWFKAIGTNFKTDETPWCSAYAGGILEECGYKSSKSAMARSYTDWGHAITKPVKGCVVVTKRGSNPRSGHVGFVDKIDQNYVYILGGNQSNRVSIAPFPLSKVLGYRIPNEKLS